MQPWYLTASALSVLASLRANPPRREVRFDTYAQTRDEWHQYAGERVDRLTAIHAAMIRRVEASGAAVEQMRAAYRQPKPQDVIAAVLGEHLSGIHFNSDLPRLAGIRDRVDAALAVREAA